MGKIIKIIFPFGKIVRFHFRGEPWWAPLKKKEGEIYECYNYSSNSGRHWHHCYLINGDNLREVNGPVRLLKRLLYYRPLTRYDISVPTPREGQNVVSDVNEWWKSQLELGKLVSKQINEQVLLIATNNFVEVWLYRLYDNFLIIPDNAIEIAGMKMYYLGVNVPEFLRRLPMATDYHFDFANKLLVFSNNVSMVQTYRKVQGQHCSVAIFEIPSIPNELKVVDSDESIKLDAGYYLLYSD